MRNNQNYRYQQFYCQDSNQYFDAIRERQGYEDILSDSGYCFYCIDINIGMKLILLAYFLGFMKLLERFIYHLCTKNHRLALMFLILTLPYLPLMCNTLRYMQDDKVLNRDKIKDNFRCFMRFYFFLGFFLFISSVITLIIVHNNPKMRSLYNEKIVQIIS